VEPVSLATRLAKLSPVLSARERAILVIRAEVAGEDPDPDLRQLMPREQVGEFNRLIAIYYIANAELGTVVRSLTNQAYLLNQWSVTPYTLGVAAAEASRQFDEPLSTKSLRNWRKRTDINLTCLLQGLEQECRDGLAIAALARWREARALETVWAEMADELDGEEIIHPNRRQELEQVKSDLRLIIEKSQGRKRRLPEPDEATLEHYRDLVEGVLRTFHLLEVP
jgi:hypothetical protein